MKKIKILTSLAGDGFSYAAGQVVVVADDVAQQWIKAGLAENADDVEAAAIAPAEKAVISGARKKKVK
ncbi:hypothetical protein [Thermincola ferriacetica]